jgi:cytoskeleton protein RodZ
MMDGGNSETHRGAGGGLADVGAMLRDRRVELKQDIDAIARQTHIKVGYLKAIEEGRRRDLPGAAYTIGFVRTYADYLGFDGNRLVNDFHAQLAGDRKRAQEAQAATEPPRMSIGPVGIAAIVLTLAVVAFFAWGYFSDTGKTDTAATEEAQDVDGEEDVAPADAPDEAQDNAAGETASDQAASSGAATPDAPTDATAPAADQTGPDQTAAATPPVEDQLPPQEADAAPTAEQDPAQSQEAAVAEGGEGAAGKIVLRAKLESWVQVTNEKSEAIFSRVLRAGETYVVPNEPGLMLTTGNAGGVEILLDGKKLKSLGSVGLVRRDVPLDPKKLKDGSAFKPANSTQVTQ